MLKKNWKVWPREEMLRGTLTTHLQGKSIVLGKFTFLITLCESLNSVIACGGSAFRKRAAEKIPKGVDYHELEYQPEDTGGGRRFR